MLLWAKSHELNTEMITECQFGKTNSRVHYTDLHTYNRRGKLKIGTVLSEAAWAIMIRPS